MAWQLVNAPLVGERKPLTIDELVKLDDKPIFIHLLDPDGNVDTKIGWANLWLHAEFVDSGKTWKEFCADLEDGDYLFSAFDVVEDHDYRSDTYGKGMPDFTGWVAFLSEPEEAQ